MSRPEATMRTAVGLPAGRLAMWWLLASEIVIFGGLLGAFIMMRVANPSWHAEAAHANVWAGGINTLVLLSSSLSVVMAHQAAEQGNTKKAANFLWLTILGGVAFLIIKFFMEYIPEWQAGYTLFRNPFWTFYYLATALHGLHVIGGMTVMAILIPAVKRGENLQRVEYAGIYWHFVDVVWIFLFPLFYLAS